MREKRLRKLPLGSVFGAFAGFLLGALAGAACCWKLGLTDSPRLWPLVGAVIGCFGGIVIGVKERKARGEFARPDIATIIGLVYGLCPALLTLLGGLGLVRGRFSALALLGMAFTGPVIGLLIGAMLDRAYEAIRNKSWGTAAGTSIAGIAAFLGVFYLIEVMNTGPDTSGITREVKLLILEEWSQKPAMRGATIEKITLTTDDEFKYTGFVDATIDQQPEHLSLLVVVREDEIQSFRLRSDANQAAAIDWTNPNILRGLMVPVQPSR